MRLAFLGTPDFAVVSLAGHRRGGLRDRLRLLPAAGAARPRQEADAFARAGLRRGARRRGPHPRLDARSGRDRRPSRRCGLDAAVVVAFGQILPREVLEAPRLGAFNLHASLLPRWRGAAPIQRAIMAGDKATGVGVMRMSEGLDEGPIAGGRSACASTRWRPPARCTTGWPRSGRALLVAHAAADRAPGRRSRRRSRRRASPTPRRSGRARPGSTGRKPARRGRPPDPRPLALPGRLVHGRRASAGRCGSRRCCQRVEDGDGAPGEVLDERPADRLRGGRGAAAGRPARGTRRAGRRRLRARLPRSSGHRSPDAALPARPRIRRRPVQGLPGAGRTADRAGLDRAGGDGASRGETLRLQAAGRTDTGVHALHQVVHIDLTRDWRAGGGARRARTPTSSPSRSR